VFDFFLAPFYLVNVYLLFVSITLSPFHHILRKVVPKNAKCDSNKYLQVFVSVVVAFKDTVYIFYYEIHLKYWKDNDVYR
jgi:hypothetical protein